jgi:hypothetical protein
MKPAPPVTRTRMARDYEYSRLGGPQRRECSSIRKVLIDS